MSGHYLLKYIKPTDSVLEIGPLHHPIVPKGYAANIEYLDLMSQEELKKFYVHDKNIDVNLIPFINYVWKGGKYRDYTDKKYDIVFSSHNIEHTCNLVEFLNNCSEILKPNGKILLAIPDRRYCFDHYRSPTLITDVLEAYFLNRKKHSLANALEDHFMRSHNDVAAYWNGEDDEERKNKMKTVDFEDIKKFVSRVEKEYVDAHVWKFSPSSFQYIMECLFNYKLIDLKITHLTETLRNHVEFYSIMEKVPTVEQKIEYVTSVSLCGDDDWLWYCLICLYSFKKYHPDIIPTVLCVPSENVDKNEKFYKFVKQLGCHYIPCHFSLRKQGIFDRIAESSVWKSHMIEATWLRLDLPLHFPDAQYAFFFDVDMIFQRNIKGLVDDICIKTPPKHIVINREDENMGVFIMNIKNMTQQLAVMHSRLLKLGMVFSSGQDNQFMVMHFPFLLEKTLDNNFNAKAYNYPAYSNPYIIHYHGPKPRNYISHYNNLGQPMPQTFLNYSKRFLNFANTVEPLLIYNEYEKQFIQHAESYNLYDFFNNKNYPIHSMIKSSIKIKAAKYGVEDQTIDVTKKLQKYTEIINHINTIQSMSKLFGDPVPGKLKKLWITIETETETKELVGNEYHDHLKAPLFFS